MERMEEDGELEAISSSIKVIRFFVVEVKLGSNIGSRISISKGCIPLSMLCG